MDATAKNTAPDPTKQPPEPNPATFGQTRPNDPNPKAVDNALINSGGQNQNSESMKDVGLVNEPTVSVHPTSGNNAGWPTDNADDYPIIDKPNMYLRDEDVRDQFRYPFDKLEVGQGFFVATQPGKTTDDLVGDLHKQIFNYRKQYSECEKDENGDDVWESVVIQTRKRKDGVLIMSSTTGKPEVGANQTNRPKLIYVANFIVRAAVKDDDLGEGQKAESDGALVIRVV